MTFQQNIYGAGSLSSECLTERTAPKLKILLAEDDANTAYMLKQNLEQSGYEVTHAVDGQAAVVAINSDKFDLALLDVMLPKKDGIQLLGIIKSKHNDMPVVILTARNLLEDRVKGFKQGCDDYVVKPFFYEELALRLEAVLRRNYNTTEAIKVFSIENVQFDFNQNSLSVDDQTVSFTPTESKILEVLVTEFNRTVPRQYLLEKVWGIANVYTSRSFDVYLNRLRKLLKPLSALDIENSHGLGYKLKTMA